MEQSKAWTVYDDEEIRIIWHPGSADFVLVTFGDLITHVNENRFFADGPAGKARIPCLGIIAKKPSWYPEKNLRVAYQAMLPFLDAYNTRVTYGGSMGGYAAIKFSRLLGATQVISLCPQWSIDPAECEGHDPGWRGFYDGSKTGMGIRADDVAGSVFIFSDKLDRLDEFHRRMILRACPAAMSINVPMVSHHVTGVFAGTQNLLRLIEACRGRNIPELVSFARELRKDSHFRWEILVARAIGRYPRLICSALAAKAEKDPQAIQLGAKHLFRAVDGFIRSGNRKGAADCIEYFRNGLIDPQSQVMAAAVLSRLTHRETRIHTLQGTTLIYDFGQRVAVHVALGDGDPTMVQRAIRLDLVGSSASLFVDTGGGRIYLWLDDHGRLVDSFDWLAGESPPRFDTAWSEAGAFTLSNAGVFICAEPGGKVVCNRAAANIWESFRIH